MRPSNSRPSPAGSTWKLRQAPAWAVAAALLIPGTADGHPEPHSQPDSSVSTVTITTDGNSRLISADGLPNHATGRFPGPGNPNRISPQQHRFRIPLHPRRASQITPLRMQPFGIALNGIPFDPFAAEWWNGDPASGWQYEPMSGAVNLGLDDSHAHVQPTGAYHYHGIPTGLVQKLASTSAPLLLGYAADGFPIYGPDGYRNPRDPSSGLTRLRSSYRVRSGTRPGGPGGPHDGAFVEDYEYVEGLGDLDECNGREGTTPEFPQGTYYYVLTDTFPYVPRAFRGEPDPSFARSGPGRGPGRPPHDVPRRRRAPQEGPPAGPPLGLPYGRDHSGPNGFPPPPPPHRSPSAGAADQYQQVHPPIPPHAASGQLHPPPWPVRQ